MGTTKSSESLALAERLRAQRSTTQADVDAMNADHGARARYIERDRHAPSAH